MTLVAVYPALFHSVQGRFLLNCLCPNTWLQYFIIDQFYPHATSVSPCPALILFSFLAVFILYPLSIFFLICISEKRSLSGCHVTSSIDRFLCSHFLRFFPSTCSASVVLFFLFLVFPPGFKFKILFLLHSNLMKKNLFINQTRMPQYGAKKVSDLLSLI